MSVLLAEAMINAGKALRKLANKFFLTENEIKKQ
jgi:hypothetical protein